MDDQLLVSHLSDALQSVVLQVSSSVGVPADQVLLLITLFASLPLGFIQTKISSVTTRHIYSAAWGVAYCYLLVGKEILHLVLASTVTFLLSRCCSPHRAPLFTTVFAMGYLSLGHIYRQYNDYLGYRIDYTTMQMLLTLKLIMFAHNVADGKLKAQNKLDEKDDRMRKFREERSVAMPSVLEFYSYVFFYPSAVAGPGFEFKDYLEFIDGTNYKKHNLSSLPSTVVPALIHFLLGLSLYIGFFMTKFLPLFGYVNTSAFLEKPFLYRVVYISLGTTFQRFKYYFCWNLAEAGCTAAGLSFNGTDKQGNYRWDRVNYVQWHKIEFGHSIRDLIANWNKPTNHCLKYYVYARVKIPSFLKGVMSERTLANFITKIFSAFWHGFYPGYYPFFVVAGIINVVDDLARASLRPLVIQKKEIVDGKLKETYRYPLKYIYDFLGWLCTGMVFNTTGASFIILDWQATILAYKSIYFWHLGALAFAYIFLSTVMLPIGKARAKQWKELEESVKKNK